MGKQSRAKRARRSLPIQASSTKLDTSPTWSILTTVSIRALRFIQFVAGRVSAVTDWLAEKIHISSKLAATGTVSVFTGAGFVMIGVNEYLAAMVCWFIAAVVCLSKGIHWNGFENYPRLTVPGKIIWILGSFVFFAFMYNWTEIKRGDEPWSIFIGPKNERSAEHSQPNQTIPANPNPRPLMVAEAQDLITLARDSNDLLRVIAILSITNRGAPSTLKDFDLLITLNTGREIKTEPLLIGKISLPSGMQYFQHQDIQQRTITKMIPTGGTEVGIHYAKLIDLGDHRNFRDATVVLHFKDAFGNKYECKFRTNEVTDRPSYVLGL